MKLTRNRLFLGILSFGLITNILIFFDIQNLYLRAFFSFMFLSIIPGLLILLMIRFKKNNFWEYLVYTIGLSIALLMFGGLAVNWVLPWLNITNQPLSLYPLLIILNFILLIFGFISYLHNKDFSLTIKYQKSNALNNIFLISPLIFPILSILGATTLNNNGSNYFTMVMLGLIIIYIFFIILLQKKINENIYPWSIWLISISLLLMWWLRSWYISGVDLNVEYHIFQLVKDNKIWSMSLLKHDYNACLSVSILPTIYSLFLKINDYYIFKLIIPLIFSTVPVVVYFFLKRYTKNIFAFLATFFFISQPDFYSGAGIPIRQEISLLFFALALLVLFSKTIKTIPKNFLLLIFLFSMVVSHYSTTYIAITLFVFTYLFGLIFRKVKNIKYFPKIHIKTSLKEKDEIKKRKYNLSGIVVLLFIISTYIWYVQITKVSTNFVDLAHMSIENMGRILSEDVRAENASPLNQFNIFYKQKNPSISLQNYINEANNKYKNILNINLYSQDKLVGYNTQIFSDSLPPKTNFTLILVIYYFGGLINKLMKLFIVIGVFYIFFHKFKKQKINFEYVLLTVFSMLVLFAVMVLPFASIIYDVERTFQQLLIVLSLSAVFGALVLFKSVNKKVSIILISVIFLTYFLFRSGFLTQISGETTASIQITNVGGNYNELYTHDSEIKSASWLSNNRDKNDLIYADVRGLSKLWLSDTTYSEIISDIFPSTLDTNAYIYSSYTNTVKNGTYIYSGGQLINYEFPTTFLNVNKNLIYNNGSSEIYK